MQPHWAALAVLTGARISLGFQFQSLASVSPIVVEELGLSYADLGTLIGLYFLPGVVMALPGGALGWRFGDKRVVAFGLVLMLAGGSIASLASDFAGLAAGRVLSGIGGVLLNVLMAKMVTDWFAGRREIVLAMAVFVNSFPIGVGLAMLTLGTLAEAAGWPAALVASAALALVALLLLGLGYRPHLNDRAATTTPGGTISLREAALVCVAGAIWGIFNGGFAVMFGFAPTFLAQAGLTPAEVGLIAAMATWLVVMSVQAGGLLAQHGVRPLLLMTVGSLGWGACLLVMALSDWLAAPAIVAAGLLMGLPVGVIMSLPAQSLRPESRAVGMGLFYTGLYVGHGLLPPVAGWLQDRTGSATAPLHFIAMVVLTMLPLYGIFRWRRSRKIRAPQPSLAVAGSAPSPGSGVE